MTTSGGRRDLDELRAGLNEWLWAHRPELGQAEVGELTHPSAGYSNETIIATVSSDEGAQKLVVRLPPKVATFPDHDLEPQVRVMEALAASGFPVPSPVGYEPDPRWLGSPFVVMPFVLGDVPGEATVFDPWLMDASSAQQRTVQDQMVDVLSQLHRVDWRATSPPLTELVRGGDGRLAEEVAYWGRYLDWAGDGSAPAGFVDLLAWCAATLPQDEPPASLLWGDARFGNLILDGHRHVRVVLDWELATIGPAEMDVGWFLGLEQVLRELSGGTVVPGFRSDEELVERYAIALGRPVRDLDFHRIFSVVRSICINYRQARISAEAGVTYPLPADETNPLFGIVARWMEAHTP